MLTIISNANEDTFVPSFIFIIEILFSYLMVLARPSKTVLNKVARTNPCLVPDLEAKTSSIMLAVRFS